MRGHQAGFRQEIEVDQIATLRIIVEQSIKFDSSYVNFVDYEKAFDII